MIADDDVYYPRYWLRDITAAHSPGGAQPRRQDVICTAHRIRVDEDGKPLPYRAWENEMPATEASPLHFATGIGGVLY